MLKKSAIVAALVSVLFTSGCRDAVRNATISSLDGLKLGSVVYDYVDRNDSSLDRVIYFGGRVVGVARDVRPQGVLLDVEREAFQWNLYYDLDSELIFRVEKVGRSEFSYTQCQLWTSLLIQRVVDDYSGDVKIIYDEGDLMVGVFPDDDLTSIQGGCSKLGFVSDSTDNYSINLFDTKAVAEIVDG